MAEKIEQTAPYVLAMVVCDNVHVDPTTGKKTLLGLFTSVSASQFPIRINSMVLYAAITDGHGPTPIEVKLVDVNESRPPIFKAEAMIPFDDPRVVIEFLNLMLNLEFPEPGEYRLQLFGCKQLLMERRIVVVPIPEAPHA
jgi:hypothetical protein